MAFASREIEVRTWGDSETDPTAEATYAGVDAYVQGLWAYHVSPSSPNLWNVTHVPTGLHVATNMTKTVARGFAEMLCQKGPTLMIDAKRGLPREAYMQHPDFPKLKELCVGEK